MQRDSEPPPKRSMQVSLLDICLLIVLSGFAAFVARNFEFAALPLACGIVGGVGCHLLGQFSNRSSPFLPAYGYCLGLLFCANAADTGGPTYDGWLLLGLAILGVGVWLLSKFAASKRHLNQDP